MKEPFVKDPFVKDPFVKDPLLIDYHIHIGQWEDHYYDAADVFEAVFAAGLGALVFSSTTTCKEGVSYTEVEKEIEKALALGCSGTTTALCWYVPAYADQGLGVERAMDSLPYGGFKIHPRTHTWDPADTKTLALLHAIFDYADRRKMPVLIHTGYDALDEADKFSPFFGEYPGARFILAHGRPLEQTRGLLAKYPQVYCDTAFMPREDRCALEDAGLGKKILPGSDFPITHYWKWKYGGGDALNFDAASLRAHYAALCAESAVNK